MERLHIIRADVCWDEHLQLAQHAAQRGLQALQLVLRGVEEGEAPQRRGGAQGPDQVICVCIYIYIYIYIYVCNIVFLIYFFFRDLIRFPRRHRELRLPSEQPPRSGSPWSRLPARSLLSLLLY